MFYRKISKYLEEYILKDDERVLCIDGARQIGKSYIIRHICQKHFKNYIELNMVDDFNGKQLFKDARTIEEFYLQVSILHGNKMGNRENTIIFIDEIQVYPHLLTLLKPLRYDNKYRYICSGSLLGVTLKKAISIPMGSIIEKEMYPMDFEEFLLANGIGENVIQYLKKCFFERKSPSENIHESILSLFKTYLYVGGLPDAVKAFVETKNVSKIREVQKETYKYYGSDAAKYDTENSLKIRRMYELMSSNIENKVKRFQFKDIENKKDVRFKRYENEFDYLISSGIALDVKAISEPKFPLLQSTTKNLIKLYFNDVGLLTNILYKNNINAIIQEKSGVNLGAVYETVVAQELKAHGYNLYYYDRRKLGEVDYLVDDYENLSALPIEIKSGREGYQHSAISKMVEMSDYNIGKAYIFSNSGEIFKDGKIIHFPIYMIMFV